MQPADGMPIAIQFGMETRNFVIRMPDKLRAAIEKKAKRLGRGVSEHIRLVLAEAHGLSDESAQVNPEGRPRKHAD
jgi:hypothetical protein